ncbi:MAG: carboxypeptidase-like regulatory domain-containing protein [Terracidiphilus sp.]
MRRFCRSTRLQSSLAYAFAILVCTGLVHAQTSTTGAIVGVVADPSGAVVASAKLSLQSGTSGAIISTTANASGQYSFPAVAPGTYTLSGTAKGFQTSVVAGVTVQVAKSTLVNVVLSVGSNSQTVVVSSGAQAELQTTDSAVGTVIGTDEVEELPTVTRRAVELTFLQVGAQPWTGGAYNGSSGTIAGVAGDQNDFTLDGLNISDAQVGGECCGNIGTGIPLPVESVEEFNSATTNQNASFGRSPGGTFSFTVRSGTPTYHGAAYWYHVDNHLDASTWVADNLGQPKPEFLDNRIGFRVGGPLFGPYLKSKLNFFLNLEIRRFPNTTQVSGLVPLPSLRQGILTFLDGSGNAVTYNLKTSTLCGPSGTTQCDPRGIGLSSVISQQFALLPTGNDANLGDQLNTTGISGPANSAQNNDNAVGRLDYALSQNWHVNGIWSWATNQIYNPNNDPGINWEGGASHILTTAREENHPRMYGGALTGQISPTLSNQFGGGLFQSTLEFQQPHPESLIPDAGVALHLPVIQDPIQIFGARGQVGVSRNWQLTDNMTKVHGKHELQFGGHYEHQYFSETRQGASQYNVYPFANIGTGQFVAVTNAEEPPTCGSTGQANCLLPANIGLWNSLYGATLGIVDSVNEITTRNPQGVANPPDTDLVSAGSWRHFEYHVGDTWRLTNSLTLSLGLMGVVETPFNDDKQRQSFIVNGQTGQPIDSVQYLQQRAEMARVGQIFNPGFAWAPIGDFRGRGYFPIQNHLGPRLAAAWSPSFHDGLMGHMFGANKTVIRGGFSMGYYRILGVGEVQFAEQSDQLLAQTSNRVAPLNGAGQPYRVGPDGAVPLPIVTQQVAVPFVPPSNYGAGTIIAFDPNYKQGTENSADITIQRDLPGNMLVEVGYLGRFGRNLEADLDLNAVPFFINDMTHKSSQNFAQAFDQVATQLRTGTAPANVTPQPWFENNIGTGATVNLASSAASDFIDAYVQTLWQQHINSAITSGPVENQQVVSTLDISPVGWSNYNGGFITLNKRTSMGLTFTINYTFSHWLTTGENSTDSGGTSPVNSYNPRYGYGDALGDRRQVINAYGIYNLPFGNGHELSGGPLRHVVNNWSWSNIVNYSTGLPLYMSMGGQPFGSSSYNESIPNTVGRNFSKGIHQGVGGSNGIGDCCGSGQNLFKNPAAVYADFRPFLISQDTTGSAGFIRGLPLFTWDMSVSKAIGIYHEGKMRLGFDFFNVFNHPLFNDPETNYLDPPGFGVINSQPGDPADGDYWTPRRLQASVRIEF